MLRTLALLKIAASLFVAVGVAPAFAQGPDVDQVQLRGLTAVGSGCPSGTTVHNLAPDGRAFTLIFSQFSASRSAEEDPAESQKECAITLDLSYPNGWSYSIFSVDYRGYAAMDENVSGTIQSNYWISGRDRQVKQFNAAFVGPFDDNYLVQDRLDLAEASWSPCGSISPAEIRTRIRVAGEGRGLFTVDSVDGGIEHVYGVQWRRCDTPDAGLDGGWYNPQGLPVSVIQSSAGLTFVDRLGQRWPGVLTSPTSVESSAWNLRGRIVDGGQKINWSNGNYWTRARPRIYDISGAWYNNLGAAVSIVQNGGALIFANRLMDTSAGEFTGLTSIKAVDWGQTAQIVNGGNAIRWTNGNVWTRTPPRRPELAGAWRDVDAGSVAIRQVDRVLTFINASGESSRGEFIGQTTVVALDWQLTGEILGWGDEILWSNGRRWVRAMPLIIDGTWYNLMGEATAIRQSGATLVCIDSSGASFQARLEMPSTIIAPDWPLTGQVSSDGNRIDWSNGNAWTKSRPSCPQLAGEWRNGGADVVRVQQRDCELTFVNRAGGTSSGVFLSSRRVQATEWNVSGDLSGWGNRLSWSNGTFWERGL